MIAAKLKRPTLKAASDRVERVLDQLERRGMKAALLKAATPMVKEAKARAPKRTGALRRSLTKHGTTDPKTQSAKVEIGPRKTKDARTGFPAVRYAHLVEFGHMAVDGSFVAPRPFMAPAFEQTKEDARKIYAREVGNDIHRMFKNARGRGRL